MSNNHGQPLPVHAAYAACSPEPTVHTGHLGAGAVEYTPADILGPYWADGSPERTDLCVGPQPDSITISGVVRDGYGRPIPHCRLEFWQADPKGNYSGGFPDQTAYDGPEMGYRGHQFTDTDGRYELCTVVPGHYKISETETRTAHVHVKAVPPKGPPLVTQLYFPGDPLNATDRWERKNDPKLLLKPAAGGSDSFAFDFVLKTAH